MSKRKPLIAHYVAKKLYGVEKTVFDKPIYVKDGCCQWCGKIIKNKRRKSFCSKECSINYGNLVYWNRGRNTYSTHILYRDDFTCRDCGVLHAYNNNHDIYIPTSDGYLEVHHILPVSEGGNDSPDNLITLCKYCHYKRHNNKENLEVREKE